MPRTIALAKQVNGMSVLRPKGGASEESLQLLLNGWITSDRTMQARPGSVDELDFPDGTVGVLAFEDKFHTFAGAATAPPTDPRVEVDILPHPTAPGTALKTIHRAFPFLGRLYVVAEFTDGVIQHYWDEDPPGWTAESEILSGGVIQPSVETGFYYENTDQNSVLAWQSNVEVAVGQFRQPTVANNYRYEIVSSTGTPPARTSNTQPTWPTTIGATVVERRYVTDTVQTPPGSSTPTQPPAGQGGGGGAGSEYSPFPSERLDDRQSIQ